MRRSNWRRCLARGLGIALLGSVLACPPAAFAQDHGGGVVRAVDNGDGTVSIGNDYLERTWSSAGGVWKTGKIVNKRTGADGRALIPAEGSEDFVISLLPTDDGASGQEVVKPEKSLDRKGWKATLTTASGAKFEHVDYLFDGDKNTNLDEREKSGMPISLVIDLGSEQTVGSFMFQKRPGAENEAWGINGSMGQYRLYVSENGTDWTPAGSGEFTRADYNLHEEGGLYNVGDPVYANFSHVQTTRYVKIDTLTDALGGTQEYCGAEVELFSDQVLDETGAPLPGDTLSGNLIKASDLALSSVSAEGNAVRAQFAPVTVGDATLSIAEVTTMEDGAHYMNSWLEITASDPSAISIDYIDTDRFVLPEGTEGLWSIPDERDVYSSLIGAHELMLGEPIYAEGMFFGSEFPAEGTDVDDEADAMQIRYYSGKSVAKMAEDGQNVSPDGKTFHTWNNVVGAAEGVDMSVVQTAFFSYIEDLATPSEFRKQYNSWYDNMMAIDDASIETSFLGVEKGLAKTGVEPLDAYVVDDGWNNYNNEEFDLYKPADSGTTYNQTGFWEFNSKFPNELYTSSSLAHKLQSTFGMWVGPQGGYNYYAQFAQYLTSKGTAELQPNSHSGYQPIICTGSRVYIDNFTKLFVDYQERFDITYWKWDGFASAPCSQEGHHHMTGGPNDMYATSDMWEAWTDAFEAFRAEREEKGKDLWINGTSYMPLSPWMLQWVNSMWIMNSSDTAQTGDTSSGAERHQAKIYYRDNVYYQMFEKNQIQFPLNHLYNHDPVYGVSDKSSASTDVFREFMLDNAMRGTAFWELYFSPSIMDDEKWEVTADVLEFAEQNHDILKNAKMFYADGAFSNVASSNAATSRISDVYGYSAWGDRGGIVSFVNPTDSKKNFTLDLTDVNGVPKDTEDLAEVQIYPYAGEPTGNRVSYGDQVTVELEPYSTKIFQYGGEAGVPELMSAKITGDNTVEVRFDERVSDRASFTVDGRTADAELKDDYRTFVLTVEGEKLADTVRVAATGIANVYGGAAGDVTADASSSGTIARAEHADDVESAAAYEFKAGDQTFLDLRSHPVTLAEQGVSGTGDFAVSLVVHDVDAPASLLSQGDDWSLGIDEQGYVTFTVGGQTVSSKHEVTTVVEKAHGTFGTDEYQPTTTKPVTVGVVNDGATHAIDAVREPNGMLKLYIDGELVASEYGGQEGRSALDGGVVTLGGESLRGYVSGVALRNSALYYDDAAEHADAYGIGVSARALPVDGWTATACSQASDTPGTGSDGPAADAIDGDTSTYWHTNYNGGDTCEDGHEITIDFGGELTFDNIEYTARPSAVNGTWQMVDVYGIDETGAEALIKKDLAVDVVNKKATVALGSTQTWSGVRIKITKAQSDNDGFHASAAEIAVSRNIERVDTSAVDALRDYAAELDAKVSEPEYTPESYKPFRAALDAAYALNPFDAASQDKVAGLREDLDRAYSGLKKAEAPIETDFSKLRAYVDECEEAGLKESDYTAESWRAYEDALAGAKSVLADEGASQTEVDGALESLRAARESLVGTDGSKPVDPSDKPDSGNEPGGGSGSGSQAGDDSTGGDDRLAQTGDQALAAVAVAAVAGIVLLGVGMTVRRRHFDR